MKQFILSGSIVTILLVVLFGSVKYLAAPVYANNNTDESANAQEVDAGSYEISEVDEGDWKSSRDHSQFINYAKCITVVKNSGGDRHPAYVVYKNRSETPEYLFSYTGWRELTLAQKRALVSGSMTFLHEILRLEICFSDEERRRYDHFKTMVSVTEIVKHIDAVFRKPEYRYEDGEWLIVDYLQFNFRNYIGDPFAAFS